MLAQLDAPFAALIAFALAFLVSLIGTPLVRRTAVRLGLVSRPVEDRWGKRVVARLGGIAIYAGIGASGLIFLPSGNQTNALLIGLTLVFFLGLIDDLKRMRPYTKLLLQLAAGSSLVALGLRIEFIPLPWLAIPLSVLWFVTIMNAMNLLDNMDGLAGGVAAIAAGFCAVHAYATGNVPALIFSLIFVGACCGFLAFNFPPARIFMGDSGSHVLGLGLGALVMMGSWQQSHQLLTVLAVPVFVLAVPIFDMAFVTLQRLLNGRSPFQGGTDHVSHRLAILGLSPRQTVLVLYMLSVMTGAISLLSLRVNRLPVMAVWMAFVALLLVVAGYLSRVRVYSVPRSPEEYAAQASLAKVTWIDTMLFHKRRILEVLIDFLIICGCYIAAHLLRFERGLVDSQERLLFQSLPIVLALQLVAFSMTRLYHGVWRYFSVSDLGTIAKGVVGGAMAAALAALYLWRFEGFSRAVFIIYGLLLFVAISASRIGERVFNQWLTRAVRGEPALIIGAGDMGELSLRQMTQHTHRRNVVGFLDDDPRKQGARIHGVPVLGTRNALPYLLEKHGVRDVVIAMQEPPESLVRLVREACERNGVRWQSVKTLIHHHAA